MMDISILDFHQCLYIPAMQKISFHLSHVRIIGTHHCVNTLREAFNCHAAYQYVLRCQDYT